jgi:hypothetical protein
MQLSILIEKGKKTSAWIDHGILSGRGNNVVKG